MKKPRRGVEPLSKWDGGFPGYISSELTRRPNTEEMECSKCPWVEVWKAKAHLRLNVSVKGNKKGSYKHVM